MSDLISRQAAIDAIERNACNTQRIMDAVKALPSVQPEPHYTDDQIQKMQDLEQAQLDKAFELGRKDAKWIPCSERLPDKDGLYIVTEQNFGGHNDADIHDVTVHLDYFYADDEEWEDSGRCYVVSVSNIIAWMPLPEPYREEGE